MLDKFLNRLPGIIAGTIVTLVTIFWAFWGAGEMYHEGWWGAWYNPLFYLIPATLFLTLTLVAIRWPRVGGWLTLLMGTAFTLFFLNPKIVDGRLTINGPIFVVSSPVIVVGILFLIEGRNRRKRQAEEQPPQSWWRRNLAYILVIAPPLLIFVGMSANSLPIVPVKENPDGLMPYQAIVNRIIMRECATVEEAIETAKSYDWSQQYGGRIDGQFMLADPTGDAVVISADSTGDIVFTRKPKGDGFLVSTNFNRARPENRYGRYPSRWNHFRSRFRWSLPRRQHWRNWRKRRRESRINW